MVVVWSGLDCSLSTSACRRRRALSETRALRRDSFRPTFAPGGWFAPGGLRRQARPSRSRTAGEGGGGSLKARQRRAATANRRGLGAAARARAQRHPSAARARRLVVCTFLCERKRGFERPRAQDAAGASRREQAKPAARGTHPLSACVGAPRLARATLRFAGGRAPAADCSRRGPARCSSTSSGPVRSKRARSRVGGGAGV